MCTHLLNTFDDLSVILHYENYNSRRGGYKEKTFVLQVHSVLLLRGDHSTEFTDLTENDSSMTGGKKREKENCVNGLIGE